MTPHQEELIATLLVQMPWANLFPVEKEAIKALRDDRDDLKRIVDTITGKIGHFAGHPWPEDGGALGLLIDVANIATGKDGA